MTDRPALSDLITAAVKAAADEANAWHAHLAGDLSQRDLARVQKARTDALIAVYAAAEGVERPNLTALASMRGVA